MFQSRSEVSGGSQNLQDFDAGSACRICLSNKGQCGLFWMNSKSKQLLAEMFSIMVDDQGCWKICVPCLQAIERAAEFKEMAAKSDRLIQQILQRSTSKVYEEKVEREVYEEPGLEENYSEDEVDMIPEYITVTSKKSAKPKIIFKPEVSQDSQPATSMEFIPDEDQEQTEEIEEYEVPEEDSEPAAPVKQYKCQLCPQREFQSKQELSKHRRIKHKSKGKKAQEEKPKLVNGKWICCGEEHNAEEYEEHKRDKHPRTYGCLVCMVKFTNRSELMRHQKENHKNVEQSTKCGICGRDYPTVGTLRSHISRMHKMSMETIED